MTDGIDLTKSIYRFQNISILSIQIAIYMGFKEIYLVGLDHDWILRMFDKSRMHFFNKKTGVYGQLSSDQWNLPMNNEFRSQVEIYYLMWSQYMMLNKFALASNIQIKNATNGGLLDVFPRVKLEDI